MSTFEYLNNKITRQVEHANRDQINRHGKNIADKPLTIEEMMKQRGKTITITYGKPIYPEHLDKSKNDDDWAYEVKSNVYNLVK